MCPLAAAKSGYSRHRKAELLYGFKVLFFPDLGSLALKGELGRSESRSHGGPKPREAALGTSVDSLSLT